MLNTTQEEELPYLHALHVVLSVNLHRLHRLLDAVGSAMLIWKAPLHTLAEAGASIETVKQVRDTCPEADVFLLWKELERLRKQQPMELVTRAHNAYPKLLHELSGGPYLLYCRGNTGLLGRKRLISIVGSRKGTQYGHSIVQDLIPPFVRAHVVTVSGLAYGVDAWVHEETVKAHGLTICVLGSSVIEEDIYPRTNQRLARSVVQQNGLLVSEYPPGTRARPYFFPERNRIIAGLSQGTVVVEASEGSGSLITARYSVEANRTVFAVPGSLYASQSTGTNWLISQGAVPVLSALSVLEELQYSQGANPDHVPIELSGHERHVLDYCTEEPMTLDEIISDTGLPPQVVLTTIMVLSMKGFVRDIGNQRFMKIEHQ